ncbi:MAG: septal ring lytic transglycosylase RlpA family protein [Candidatus Binatia bacterium]
MLVLTAGCAASTYPLNPQLAAQVGLPDQSVSFTERVGRDPDGAGPIVQQGSCSWYGPGFHGRRTANGEVFDTHALTAAHPTLPFGSEVEVTNVKSGKKVRVRVNDRGPFIHGRILDLSHAAAASLDIVRTGTAHVQLRLVDVDDAKWSNDAYALEVASFRTKIDAEKFLQGLSASQRSAGLYYVKAPDGETKDFRVRFGPFTCEKSAKSVANKLKRVGLEPSLTREDLTSNSTSSGSRKTAVVN